MPARELAGIPGVGPDAAEELASSFHDPGGQEFVRAGVVTV